MAAAAEEGGNSGGQPDQDEGHDPLLRQRRLVDCIRANPLKAVELVICVILCLVWLASTAAWNWYSAGPPQSVVKLKENGQPAGDCFWVTWPGSKGSLGCWHRLWVSSTASYWGCLTLEAANATAYVSNSFCQVAAIVPGQSSCSAETATRVDYRFFIGLHHGSMNLFSAFMPPPCKKMLRTDVVDGTFARDCKEWCDSLPAISPACVGGASWIGQQRKLCFKVNTRTQFLKVLPSWSHWPVTLLYLLTGVALACRHRQEESEGTAEPPSTESVSPDPDHLSHLDLPLCCCRSTSDRCRARWQLVFAAPGALGDNALDLLNVLTFLKQGQPYWAALSFLALVPVLWTDPFQARAFRSFWESYLQGFASASFLRHQVSEGSREAPIGGLIAAMAFLITDPHDMTSGTLVQLVSAFSSMILAMPAAAVAEMLLCQSREDGRVLLEYHLMEAGRRRVPWSIKWTPSVQVIMAASCAALCFWEEQPFNAGLVICTQVGCVFGSIVRMYLWGERRWHSLDLFIASLACLGFPAFRLVQRSAVAAFARALQSRWSLVTAGHPKEEWDALANAFHSEWHTMLPAVVSALQPLLRTAVAALQLLIVLSGWLGSLGLSVLLYARVNAQRPSTLGALRAARHAVLPASLRRTSPASEDVWAGFNRDFENMRQWNNMLEEIRRQRDRRQRNTAEPTLEGEQQEAIATDGEDAPLLSEVLEI